jgi:hypothetical protein
MNYNIETDFNSEIDTEYYSDVDNESDSEDIIAKHYYNPEEISKTKNTIVLCQLYNCKNFGNLTIDNQIVESHYLVFQRFKLLNMELINMHIKILTNFILCFVNSNRNRIKHPLFKNYINIIQHPNYIQPEIAECIYLKTNECIAIKKTIWIRLIQRNWKKIMKQRTIILDERQHYKSLHYREIYGIWDITCRNLPTIKGMLYNLLQTTKPPISIN